MPPKRACDNCISRKVRCSGSSPCETCSDAAKPVTCTYLRPARKRGPKKRRSARRCQSPELESDHAGSAKSNDLPERISRSVLALIVRHYRQSSYSVWPVINADGFLRDVNDIEPENSDPQAAMFDCLVTSLCAATMAQLHLAPIWDGSCSSFVDSSVMGKTCLRIRDDYNCDRGNIGICSILTSFFLHVYHAKLNQRTAAMLYIQEAIAGARELRLDKMSSRLRNVPDSHLVVNRELIFPLLWVTERGYALHLNVSPLYIEPVSLPEIAASPIIDSQARGLIDLVRLFVAFDHISVRRQPHASITSAPCLTDTESKLSSVRLTDDQISARTADCHITREWMRTILWQKALALGLLSSTSYTAMMNFGFPGQIGRDLLRSLRYFTAADLLPLGRDQLLKCFEIASTLADTILLTSATSSGCEFGPQDFLHALYQKLLPSFEQDTTLKSNLRCKMAEVLVTAPARLLIEPTSRELEEDSRHRATAWNHVIV